MPRIEVDGVPLCIFPVSKSPFGHMLHLNPYSSTGYLRVYYRGDPQSRPFRIDGPVVGSYASAEEAANAVAVALGPPSQGELLEVSNGTRLIINHNVGSGYLWVRDKSHKGYSASSRFFAETPNKEIGRFATNVAAAEAVSKYVASVAGASFAHLFSPPPASNKRKAPMMAPASKAQRAPAPAPAATLATAAAAASSSTDPPPHPAAPPVPPPAAPPPPPPPPASSRSIKERMMELVELRNLELITQEDFDNKKKELLSLV